MPSWSQKSRGELFQQIFAIGIFLGRGEAPCRNSTDCCFVSGSQWYNQFVHGHQSRQEIIWIAPKKFQKLLRRLAPLTFFIRVQAFRDPLRGELSHVQIFMNDGPTRSREMPSCSATDFAEIRRSSKISSWILSIISGVVTVLGRPGRGASQVEKSPV